MILAIDIDGTLCSLSKHHYDECIPNQEEIARVNRLYGLGHTIIIFTARGTRSGTDWKKYTEEQLQKWGVKYHELRFGKPHADAFIDDKGFMSVKEWIESIPRQRTIVAVSGYFDPMHIGHLEMFKKAREYGDKLVVIVGNDECLMNKKGYVFMEQDDRIAILKAVRYIDEVVLNVDSDGSCNKTLRLIRPDVYVKGTGGEGKREERTCQEIGCRLVSKVVGRVRSSSEIVKQATLALAGMEESE